MEKNNNMKIIKRVRKAIPTGIARKLWVKSGGRCEYDICNILLWKDSLTQKDMNKAYISHIIAASPKGTRGHKTRSKELEINFSNLMLLCDECHNRIDEAQPDEHSEERLLEMKNNHEDRIEFLTGIKIDKKSHMIFYGAKIGNHESPLNFNDTSTAIIPNRYPVSDRPIELGIKNLEMKDNSSEYWNIQDSQLINLFNHRVKPLLGKDPVQHFSIFALAPQPLLIRFGTLLSDLYPADVYQKHREPNSWNWQEESQIYKFKIIKPIKVNGIPALVISLSGNIMDDRIFTVLGKKANIWKITIENPNNDFMKTRALLIKFRLIMRKVFDEIKSQYGSNKHLHLFPAMPVSAAVELGRVWMPKADMPLIIYDENTSSEGFLKAIEIKNF